MYRWIERIPGGTRENDGLETEIMGGCGREISVATNERLTLRSCVRKILVRALAARTRAWLSG